jgi:hypothetical protein
MFFQIQRAELKRGGKREIFLFFFSFLPSFFFFWKREVNNGRKETRRKKERRPFFCSRVYLISSSSCFSLKLSQVVSKVVEAVGFSFYNEEEVRAMSVKHITAPIIMDSLGRPVPGGLYDPSLGPLEQSGRFGKHPLPSQSILIFRSVDWVTTCEF